LIPQQEVLEDLLKLKGTLLRAVSRPLKREEELRVFSPEASTGQGVVRLDPQRENQIFAGEISRLRGLKGNFKTRRPQGNLGGSLTARGEISALRHPSTGVNLQDGTIGLLLLKFGVAWALSETEVHPGIRSVGQTLSEVKALAEMFDLRAVMLVGAALREKVLGVREPSETTIHPGGQLAGRTLSEAKAPAEAFGPGEEIRLGAALQEKSVVAEVREVHLAGGRQQAAEADVWVAAETRRVKRNKVVSEPIGTRQDCGRC